MLRIPGEKLSTPILNIILRGYLAELILLSMAKLNVISTICSNVYKTY